MLQQRMMQPSRHVGVAASLLNARLCRAAAAAAERQQHTSSSCSSSRMLGPPCFTLEASVGAANPVDLQLLSTGMFGAEVHPDLPIATTWCVEMQQQFGNMHLIAALTLTHPSAAGTQSPMTQQWPCIVDTRKLPHELCFTCPGPYNCYFKVNCCTDPAVGYASSNAYSACTPHPSSHLALSPPALCRHGLYKQLSLKFGSAGAARKQAAVAAAASRITAAAAAAQMSDSAAEAEAALAFAGARPVMHVATVGAQLRSLQDTAEAMCWAAGVTPTGQKLDQQDERPHADALLLVSGSHPVRQLPMASQLLPGSVHMLQRAVQLKQQGVLPQQLELWAVANPVTEPDASYTEQKVNRWVLLDGCVGSCTARTAAAGWLLFRCRWKHAVCMCPAWLGAVL
jgi:hypothetical protein